MELVLCDVLGFALDALYRALVCDGESAEEEPDEPVHLVGEVSYLRLAQLGRFAFPGAPLASPPAGRQPYS